MFFSILVWMGCLLGFVVIGILGVLNIVVLFVGILCVRLEMNRVVRWLVFYICIGWLGL